MKNWAKTTGHVIRVCYKTATDVCSRVPYVASGFYCSCELYKLSMPDMAIFSTCNLAITF